MAHAGRRIAGRAGGAPRPHEGPLHVPCSRRATCRTRRALAFRLRRRRQAGLCRDARFAGRCAGFVATPGVGGPARRHAVGIQRTGPAGFDFLRRELPQCDRRGDGLWPSVRGDRRGRLRAHRGRVRHGGRAARPGSVRCGRRGHAADPGGCRGRKRDAGGRAQAHRGIVFAGCAARELQGRAPRGMRKPGVHVMGTGLHPFPMGQLIWPATALKSALFLFYFGFVFDGTYTFFDDWNYLRFGKQLLQSGVGVLNLMHNYAYVRSMVKSANLFYYAYNATALAAFGQGYFAPVAANILLTFVAAGVLAKAARLGLGMSRRTSIGLFAFLALSPSILAWSTVANLKDILVATGTAGMVYAVALVEDGRFKRAAANAVLWGLVLAVTRFYVPLMLGAAFGTMVLCSRRGRRNPWMWLAAVVALVVIVHGLGHGSIGGALHEFRSRVGNPLTGVVRFIATPIPFHTQPNYAFLDLPQLFFWVMLPFQFYGMVAAWR